MKNQQNLSTINQKCNYLRHSNPGHSPLHPFDKIRIIMLKSIFNPFLNAIFVVFSQKSHLNRIFICFSLALYCMDISELFAFLSELFSELSLLPYGWELLQRTSNGSRSFQKIFQIHVIYNNKHEYCHVFIKRLVF